MRGITQSLFVQLVRMAPHTIGLFLKDRGEPLPPSSFSKLVEWVMGQPENAMYGLLPAAPDPLDATVDPVVR